MNSAASLLDREVEVQSEIRKVRTFGRGARVVCAAIFGFGLVGSVGVLLIGAFGLISPAPDHGVGFSPQQRMWAIPLSSLSFAVLLAAVYQLYRVFGNLAAGAIYTRENVRRVRNVGLLWFLWATLGILIPVAWSLLVAAGLIEPSDPPKPERWLSWQESLSSFVSAGLILLVSWIMDVGLYQKDQADALQREADLVI